MSWLIVAILAYFLLAFASLFDRYFLVGPIKNPRTYTFYVGILGLFMGLIIIPFGVNFSESNIVILGIFAGLLRTLAFLFLAKSIVESEISRVIPAIGGFLPIFSFFLFLFFFPGSEILNLFQIIAFLLLLGGSVLIYLKKFSLDFLNIKFLKYPILSALFFALSFFLAKNLYFKTSFLSALSLILIGGGLGSAAFLIYSDVRKDVFKKRTTQKISGLFVFGQAVGGAGVFLQQYAVFLAKPNQVPLINALEGIRYVFLLFFVFILSNWKPRLLKEETEGMTIFQKIIAIILIGIGLAILSVK